ncbi:MAG: MBL fold metallo-hydrolase [Ignavibacteria bacterium]|nr:MBL fold metallo-hydrolase [Ignavibacteria bacterium]
MTGMNRKEFLKLSGILFGGLMIPSKKTFAKYLLAEGNFRSLREGVGIYTNRGGTIGWYVSDDAAVIIDSQFPETAKYFMDNLSNKHNTKVDFLFNTHHHNDHTAGNVYLKDFVKDIIAHEDCVKLQKQKAKDGSNIVTANRTFTKEWNEELPAEKITAWHLVPAHTSGDAVVFFENANVAHLGDLVFNGMYPYMDLSGGCSISGSVKFLDAVINKYDDDTLFIFGHAATPEQVTGNREDVVHMKNYMEALLSFVSKQIKDGRRLEEIYSAVFVPGFEHQKANWEGALKMNLDAAYKELNP